MKAVGGPDAGNLPVRFDEGLMGNAISLLYHFPVVFISSMPHLLSVLILYFNFMHPEMRIDSNPQHLLAFLPISI